MQTNTHGSVQTLGLCCFLTTPGSPHHAHNSLFLVARTFITHIPVGGRGAWSLSSMVWRPTSDTHHKSHTRRQDTRAESTRPPVLHKPMTNRHTSRQHTGQISGLSARECRQSSSGSPQADASRMTLGRGPYASPPPLQTWGPPWRVSHPAPSS